MFKFIAVILLAGITSAHAEEGQREKARIASAFSLSSSHFCGLILGDRERHYADALADTNDMMSEAGFSSQEINDLIEEVETVVLTQPMEGLSPEACTVILGFLAKSRAG
jgi:hypothetical protein